MISINIWTTSWMWQNGKFNSSIISYNYYYSLWSLGKEYTNQILNVERLGFHKKKIISRIFLPVIFCYYFWNKKSSKTPAPDWNPVFFDKREFRTFSENMIYIKSLISNTFIRNTNISQILGLSFHSLMGLET